MDRTREYNESMASYLKKHKISSKIGCKLLIQALKHSILHSIKDINGSKTIRHVKGDLEWLEASKKAWMGFCLQNSDEEQMRDLSTKRI